MEKKTVIQELIDIVEMDYNNGVQISMKVFHGMLTKALVKERQQMVDFNTEVMKQGLGNEGGTKWNDAYKPKIEKEATTYLDTKFDNTRLIEHLNNCIEQQKGTIEFLHTQIPNIN